MILRTFLILLNYAPPFLSILDTADLETPTWRATAAGKKNTQAGSIFKGRVKIGPGTFYAKWLKSTRF